MNKKRLSWQWGFVTVLFVGFVGVAGYLLSDGRLFDASRTAPQKLALGAEKSLLTAAIWVAEDQGFFREAGLDVTIREFDSGRLSFLAMLKGEVDVSTVAPTPIMFSSFDRDDFCIIATMVYSDNDVKVIARADKGIRSAEDLAGKRVGTPKGTTGQFFLDSFLIYKGLASAGVLEVSIMPSDLPGALESGEVDAIVIWEPHANNAKKRLNEKAVQLPSSEVYRETFNLVATKALTKNRPQVLERLLLAIDKATSLIRTRKAESQKIVSRRLGISMPELASLWDDFVFEISLDKTLIVTLEDEARWAIRKNLTRQDVIPNYLNFVYLDALRKIKPQAVSLIR